MKGFQKHLKNLISCKNLVAMVTERIIERNLKILSELKGLEHRYCA
jgi:hypothetical protein